MHSTTLIAMHDEHRSRAATMRHDAAIARCMSATSTRKISIALQRRKRGEITLPNTYARYGGSENHDYNYVSDFHSTDTNTGTDITVAECIKEIALSCRHVTTEGYRAVMATYEVLVAAARLLAHVCGLTWTVGRLAVVVGRQLYEKGKCLWERLIF